MCFVLPPQCCCRLLDAVRVWSVARSPQQVATFYSQNINTSDPTLNLAFSFSNIDKNTVLDLSSAHNDGVIGSLPGLQQQATFVNNQPSMLPVSPVFVISDAPTIDGGPLLVEIAPFQTAIITLLANDPDGDLLSFTIDSLPALSFGTITQFDHSAIASVPATVTDSLNRLRFTPSATYSAAIQQLNSASPGATTNASALTITLQFSVNDGAARSQGQILLLPQIMRQPRNISLLVPEDQPVIISLGSIGSRGQPLTAVILTLPTAGLLYFLA